MHRIALASAIGSFFIGASGTTAALAEEGGCGRLRELHAAGLRPRLSADAEALRGQVLPAARPSSPIGDCWRTPDGAVWGLVLSDLEASESVWEPNTISIGGEILAVRVAPDGAILRTRVGQYIEDHDCTLEVRAEIISPPGGLLVDVNPYCGEAAMESGARWVVVRSGKLIEPAAALRPLTLSETGGLLSHRLIRAELPGGLGGSYFSTFPVPYQILSEGDVEVDVTALETMCEGLTWSKIDPTSNEVDSTELIGAFACDWFRGIDLTSRIKRATASCPKAPKRRAGEDADEFEMRSYNERINAPMFCQVVDTLKALAKKKPPASLGKSALGSTPAE